MRNSIKYLLTVCLALVAVSMLGMNAVSGNYSAGVYQDQEPPPPPPVAQDRSPSDIVTPVEPPSVLQNPPPVIVQDVPPIAAPCDVCGCCNCCCPPPCPPPPVWTTLCLTEPCGCCDFEVRVCVPACCAGEAPRVVWRRGILGRQIATLCWDCCGHRVKVVVGPLGFVRVWG